MAGQLGALLGRWHQWRSAYSHERGLVKSKAAHSGAMHDDSDFDSELMAMIEREVDALPRAEQAALQHVARAECLGVEVMFTGRLPVNRADREVLIERALHELHKRLARAGVL